MYIYGAIIVFIRSIKEYILWIYVCLSCCYQRIFTLIHTISNNKKKKMFPTEFLLLNSYYYTNTATTTNSLTLTWKRNINDLARYNDTKTRNKRDFSINDNRYIYDNERCEYTVEGSTCDKKIKRTQKLEREMLDQEAAIYNDKYRDLNLPLLENINLNDLNIDDDNYFTINNRDIEFNKEYQPIYTRRNKKQAMDDYDNNNTSDNEDSNDSRIVIKNQIMNSNFLKLYAIENNSIKNQILPEIIIDDKLLQHLNSIRINQLDFDSDIKLAILTKKKLWIDMLNNYNGNKRSDIRGKYFPWNLEFVPIKQGTSDKNKDYTALKQQHPSTMNLKPCGKISKGPHHPDIQYVVKGWCDGRFQQ